MTADAVELRGLRLLAHIGVPDAERAVVQPLEIDLDVEVDLTAAGSSDALADAVDYGAVVALVTEVVGSPTALLEALAGRLADAVLDHDQRIEATTVWVRKLRPPVPADLATAAARVRRVR